MFIDALGRVEEVLYRVMGNEDFEWVNVMGAAVTM